MADETNCIGVHISADGWYMCVRWHQSLDSGESRIDPLIIFGCINIIIWRSKQQVAKKKYSCPRFSISTIDHSEIFLT